MVEEGRWARRPGIVGVGAGGHAKVLLEIVRARGELNPVALVDSNPALAGRMLFGVPVIGGDEELVRMRDQGVEHAFVGVGSTGDSRVRERIFEHLLALGFSIPRLVHPSAVVSPSAHLGRGVMIMAGAIVNAEAHLGDNVIVNSGAIVEHDCRVGDHAHLGPRASLAGGVTVGACAHVGIGAVVLQGLTVGARAIVGAGSVVLHDVPDGVTVFGVPARPRNK